MLTTILDLGEGPFECFNGTPHSINLVSGAVYRQDIRKHVGGEEIAVIPPSGILLSARLATVPCFYLGGGVEVARQVAVACDELPEAALGADLVVVSAMYATAYRQLHPQSKVRLATIRDLVVESVENPRPVGCRGFAFV